MSSGSLPPVLRALRRALMEDAEAEVLLALRVAVLMTAGHQRVAIAKITGASPAEVRAAQGRLERAAERFR